MNLILWRHAEAEPHNNRDLQRRLTPKGRRQARTMAKWLRRRLPKDLTIAVSPARRTLETVEPLSRKYRIVESIAPDRSRADRLGITLPFQSWLPS